jgi:hypothetical protein
MTERPSHSAADRHIQSRTKSIGMNRRPWPGAWKLVTVGLLIVLSGCATISQEVVVARGPGRPGPDWRTRAERTGYAETARYAEVVAYCRRLADFSPHVHYTTFGTSAQGRPLPLLILSRDRAFTPAAARASEKALVLVQNCIHPGECAGKDASLALARDIAVTGELAGLLDHVNLLIMPIFNPDGHERFGPASRINQRGPREAGWRVTATNLDLNRDYIKADAVEMPHWLRGWTAWQPDLLIDNHTTNGTDHQYDMLYAATVHADTAPEVADWVRGRLLPPVLAGLAADGCRTFPYGDPPDRADPSAGYAAAVEYSPRYSTGYAAACNRPALLVEAHALKTYERRVWATQTLLRHVLAVVNADAPQLKAAVAAADRHSVAQRGAGGDGTLVLQMTRGAGSEPVVYQAVAQHLRPSDVTGGLVVEYGDTPVDVETRLYAEAVVARAVQPPPAYLVPPQWTEIIERLQLHGVEFFRLCRPESLEVELYRLEDVTFETHPSEGRFGPRFNVSRETAQREFPAGTVVVLLNQRRARLAVHLLDAEAPDALLRRGLFNAIFERREYAETYALEPLAQRMLAADPALRAEFAERLQTDGEFARSPGARLEFFYRRSPYWDDALNLYPGARLLDADAVRRLSRSAPSP